MALQRHPFRQAIQCQGTRSGRARQHNADILHQFGPVVRKMRGRSVAITGDARSMAKERPLACRYNRVECAPLRLTTTSNCAGDLAAGPFHVLPRNEMRSGIMSRFHGREGARFCHPS